MPGPVSFAVRMTWLISPGRSRTILQAFSVANLSVRRQEIRAYASERYSWRAIGERTRKVYELLLDENKVTGALPAPDL